jgi:MinD-like ATPase involved in chromosome partitioning or flagellar assembly
MIITFYSYKGGVGRSMALANVADLMARSGLRVLIVDFDLEAPGLEHFFPVDHEEIRGRVSHPTKSAAAGTGPRPGRSANPQANRTPW